MRRLKHDVERNMTSEIEATIDTYNKVAAVYAERNRMMPDNVRRSAERFMNLLPDGGSIIDIGCGFGRDMAFFESKGFQVHGIDGSSAMLTEARKQVVGKLTEGNFEHINFDEIFHGAWCNASLLHLPKAQLGRTIKAIYSILFESGVLFIYFKTGAGERVIYFDSDRKLGRFFSYYREWEIDEIAEEIGFIQVKEFNYTGETFFHRILKKRTFNNSVQTTALNRA